MNKEEIDLAIGMINSIINLIKQYDPAIEQNKGVMALNKAIAVLQELGL